jgi:hypothetical protein
MDRGADYCWSKAAEFKQWAEEATDECTRAFLSMMSENWTIAASGFEDAKNSGVMAQNRGDGLDRTPHSG